MTRALVLGGTTEASLLARRLAESGIDAVFSYAGRTDAPVAQPLPTRIGGFGGVAGLVEYLRAEGISHVVDATHPFAAQMSRNAIAACAEAGVPLVAFERAAWIAGPGDRWSHVPDMAGAVAALPDEPARVFLAIGKQNLQGFAAKPQHHYLLRLVDAPAADPLPDCTVILSRGPFSAEDDLELLRQHNITHIVAKNAGGSGAEAKLVAARALGLPVILIDRPALPARAVLSDLAQVMAWLGHTADLGV
ncbi:MAG: cobalt-precorrin-6A reductase [Rhodobacteraceae bacterium]|nr:cobalt-precorrin-6A reductase [Paracoccaceae bacterium]